MRKSLDKHRQEETNHNNEDYLNDNISAQATTMVYDLEIENKEENGDDTVVKKEVIVYDDPNNDIVYDDPNNDVDTLHETQDDADTRADMLMDSGDSLDMLVLYGDSLQYFETGPTTANRGHLIEERNV